MAEDTFSSSLQQYLVTKAPDTAFYIPNFISEDEEAYLMERIATAPKPKWECLGHRRLQNWGGIVGKRKLFPVKDIPRWLQSYMDKLASFHRLFPETNLPNHVLINEYQPGQGIMPHEDGPAYYPMVTNTTVGSHTLLDIYKIEAAEKAKSGNTFGEYVGSLLLEPRSLFVMKDSLYTRYLHGIEERAEDVIDRDKIFNLDHLTAVKPKQGDVLHRKLRYSLTIRNVPRQSCLTVRAMLSTGAAA